jgi:hypothetical protein
MSTDLLVLGLAVVLLAAACYGLGRSGRTPRAREIRLVRPHDQILITTPRPVSIEGQENIRRQFLKFLEDPKTYRVAVLGDGLEVHVIRRQDLDTGDRVAVRSIH